MGRQFPPAGGTVFAARPANGRGVPRLRISALRYPLYGVRRVRNRQLGPRARRDAPPAMMAHDMTRKGGGTMPKFLSMTLQRHARPCAGHPRLAWRQRKAWMAGT